MAKLATAQSMEDILDQQMGDWEAPIPLPAGNYVFVIDSHRQDKSAKKQTPFIEFSVHPIEAIDVNEEDLEEAGGLEKKKLRLTFYFTEESKYRFQDFCQNDLGLEVKGKGPMQVAAEATGCQFVGTVKHRNSEDGERSFAEITATTAV